MYLMQAGCDATTCGVYTCSHTHMQWHIINIPSEGFVLWCQYVLPTQGYEFQNCPFFPQPMINKRQMEGGHQDDKKAHKHYICHTGMKLHNISLQSR